MSIMEEKCDAIWKFQFKHCYIALQSFPENSFQWNTRLVISHQTCPPSLKDMITHFFVLYLGM